jgi:hypothetical protein
MSYNATTLQTTVSDTQSEGQQSPTSGTEELVRNSLATAGLINVPTSSDFHIGYGTADATRSPWFEPSSWQTPSPSPSWEPSLLPPELTERSCITIPQTLIPADFVRRTLNAAQSWEAAYRPIEAALTHQSWNHPFHPYQIPYHHPIPPPTPARSPSPAPNPSPSHRLLRGSTVWEHYLHTQGGRVRNPLYPSTTPTQRKAQKPRRYTTRLEELREEEILALSQIPTGGQMLTCSYLGKIKRTPLPPYPVSD